MGNLNQFFRDLGRNAYGIGENVASLGSAAIAEPVAGFAAMYDPANGAQAIREGMTYTPRTQAGQMYQQGAARTLGTIAKPAMPVIDTWQKGVDIAGGYSPMAGAALRTVPAAIGVAMGAKPALQAGRQVSNSLGAMQARMIANANAPSTLNTAGFRGQRGVFAGINALTADKEALAKAQQMIAQGVDPAQVWKETGWGKGVDGKWRFEIDDSQINLHDKNLRDVYNISDAMSENDLLKAYPILKDDFLAIGRNDRHLGGAEGMMTDSTTPNQKSIAINGNIKNDDLKSVLMHEVQHAIQHREGFARGGSPDQFKGKLPSKQALNDAKVMAVMLTRDSNFENVGQNFVNMMGRYPDSNAMDLVRYSKLGDIQKMTHDPYEAYQRLAGEVEARSVQNRLHLDQKQRRDNYPFVIGRYGYGDTRANAQIIDFGNNKANAQRPLTEFEQAHATAQRNAALPVNQGGLGLSADNTAMDRARAMGFDVDNPVYHGTGADIEAFDPKLLKETSQYMKGVFTTDKPDIASNYGDTVYPLVQKQGYTLKDKRTDRASGKTPKEVDTIRDKDKNIIVTTKPENIRSRFAAFDPMQRQSSNLLAQSAKFAPAATLGAYMANEKRKEKRN